MLNFSRLRDLTLCRIWPQRTSSCQQCLKKWDFCHGLQWKQELEQLQQLMGALPASHFPSSSPGHELFWIFPKAKSVEFQELIAWSFFNTLIHFPSLFFLKESLW